jgi:hypothetical protein
MSGVGVRVGSGFIGLVEEPACDPGKGRVLDEAQGGVDAGVETVDAVSDRLHDHLGRHEGRRMQAVDRDPCRVELFGEGHPSGDHRELRLSIGALAAVAMLQGQVIEVDRCLADRGNIDDASGCLTL